APRGYAVTTAGANVLMRSRAGSVRCLRSLAPFSSPRTWCHGSSTERWLDIVRAGQNGLHSLRREGRGIQIRALDLQSAGRNVGRVGAAVSTNANRLRARWLERVECFKEGRHVG